MKRIIITIVILLIIIGIIFVVWNILQSQIGDGQYTSSTTQPEGGTTTLPETGEEKPPRPPE